MAFAVGGLLVGLSAPASADQEAHRGGRHGAVAVGGEIAGAASDVEAYWTPERMAAAVPVVETLPEEPAGRAGLQEAAGVHPSGPQAVTEAAEAKSAAEAEAAEAAGVAAPLVRASADAAGPQDPVMRSVGQVMFHNPSDGKDHRCSAAAVNSPSKMMVLTAAHCIVVGGSGLLGEPTVMTNWVFIPAWNTGGVEAPYGKFPAKSYRGWNLWTKWTNHDYDYAFVTVRPNEKGEGLVETVGGNALGYNYGYEQSMRMVGYPLGYSSGHVQWRFVGTTRHSTRNPNMLMMQQSYFDHGASGGPWFRTYDPLTKTGMINGVTSLIHPGGTPTSGNNDSPRFDELLKQLWDIQGPKV
ncbi:trypsin-like serine peptidase [Streptomyces yangpuensis]|uniref:trypsin-like serine peptidase n=1 Tax=Streptomyces yangpuensis TaxID=1648182 RepID=UPI0036AAAF18